MNNLQQDSIQFLSHNDSLSLHIQGGVKDSLFTQTSRAIDSLPFDSLGAGELIPSILDNPQIQAQNIAPGELHYGNEDWITIHFILGLIVYAWIRLFYTKRLKQVFKSLMGARFMGMLAREGNIFKERISIALMIIYLISTSLLIYLFFTRLLHFAVLQLTSFKLFSFIMLMVIFLWIFKNLANTIIGKVFKNPVVISEFMLTNFIFNITTGSILLPILILAVYIPSVEMVYFGLIIWVIAFIYRLIRLLFASLSYTKFSLFNRILYLCTFELTPVLVITKLVMSNLE